jgi:hypothetical protein
MQKRKLPTADHRATGITKSVCPMARYIAGPERLVGLGFRYWMHGKATGDIESWERAWGLYSGVLGVSGARIAVGCLSSWVGAVSRTCQRDIEIAAPSCPDFCGDERVAISMIAACQHQTCPAMRACAFALVETSLIDGVVEHAQEFADTLKGLDHVLSPGAIVPAPTRLLGVHQRPH